MAARLWQWLLCGDLLFAAVCAAAAVYLKSWPLPCALALGLALAIATPSLFVAASFALAAAVDPAKGTTPRRAAVRLRAMFAEWLDFDRAVLSMIFVSWPELPVAGPSAPARAARPVLLIHGFLCNRGVWRPWIERLRAAGFGPIEAIDLEPLLGDIDRHADTVARELRRLQDDCGGGRVAIIAHSMGGLVARAALGRAGPAVISGIVAIASPQQGSMLARWSPWLLTRQMRPQSRWLAKLAASETTPPAVPFICVYSVDDNLIVPPRSALLDGARPVRLDGIGHLGTLIRRRCIEAAIAALASAVPG